MLTVSFLGPYRNGGRDVEFRFVGHVAGDETLRPTEIEFASIGSIDFEPHPEYVIEYDTPHNLVQVWRRSDNPDSLRGRGILVAGPLAADIVARGRVIGSKL